MLNNSKRLQVICNPHPEALPVRPTRNNVISIDQKKKDDERAYLLLLSIKLQLSGKA